MLIIIAFCETVERAPDGNEVDERFVREDNKTVLPLIACPEVVFDEVTVPLNGVAILCQTRHHVVQTI